VQYELVQDALTSLFNSVAIVGTSMIVLTSISTYLTYSRRQQLSSQLPHTEEPQPGEQYLQEIQQELEQTHQEKAQIQTYLDAVKLELELAQQDLKQIQRELEQLQQHKSQLHSHLAVVQLELL